MGDIYVTGFWGRKGLAYMRVHWEGVSQHWDSLASILSTSRNHWVTIHFSLPPPLSVVTPSLPISPA